MVCPNSFPYDVGQDFIVLTFNGIFYLQEAQTIVEKKGLNMLINNAGYFDQSNAGELRHITRSIMQKHFDINVSGKPFPTFKKKNIFKVIVEFDAILTSLIRATGMMRISKTWTLFFKHTQKKKKFNLVIF